MPTIAGHGAMEMAWRSGGQVAVEVEIIGRICDLGISFDQRLWESHTLMFDKNYCYIFYISTFIYQLNYLLSLTLKKKIYLHSTYFYIFYEHFIINFIENRVT